MRVNPPVEPSQDVPTPGPGGARAADATLQSAETLKLPAHMLDVQAQPPLVPTIHASGTAILDDARAPIFNRKWLLAGAVLAAVAAAVVGYFALRDPASAPSGGATGAVVHGKAAAPQASPPPAARSTEDGAARVSMPGKGD